MNETATSNPEAGDAGAIPAEAVRPPGQWYALHTLSGQEARSKRTSSSAPRPEEIGDLLLEVVIPIERVLRSPPRQRVETERKLYPATSSSTCSCATTSRS